jgi:hypothetical protein
MEAIRSEVDNWLLVFIRNHVFSSKDFYEKRDGGSRLAIELTPLLVKIIPLWTNKLEPLIEKGNSPRNY